MARSLLLCLIAWSICAGARAQHEHGPPPTPTPGSPPGEAAPAPAHSHPDDPQSTPREPAPSGEEPNPDPMAAMEEMEPVKGAGWSTMLHGYVFATANRQGGPSGGRDFESQNHLAAAAIRELAGGKLSLLGTFTLEPATIPVEGSRELFQRGETYRNVLLVDRQHPHELFVQLAAAWERAVSSRLRLRVYLAPIGEPALGPVAFPHRLSASESPVAPLSHHNQDSTHIAADVVTVGVTASIVTLEGSVFHGREPDENRWDIEQGALDSYSGRLTVRPMRALAFQVSSGHLESPEKIEPGNQTRSTASLSYQKATRGGFVAATLATGRNQTEHGPEWGSLAEATWKFGGRNFLYGRVESVDRDLNELVEKRQSPEGIPIRRTKVQAGTLGYVRDFTLLTEAETGAGAAVTFYRFASSLRPVYGSRPVSVQAFFRVRFGSHHGGAGHASHTM